MRTLAGRLIVPLAAVLFASCSGRPTTLADAPAAAVSYENPVLPGDYPDPSVIRVGDEYWATATTSQWAPIFPLLRSTDLVNWRLSGSVFQTPPSWSAGSYWAPELWHDDNRFFVYYTARKRDGPLCVAVADAPTPDGPYTDHGPLVCQEVGSIDALPVRDGQGRRYLIWKEDGNSRKLPTPLWAQPLSDNGLELTGEKREILRNEAPWEAHLIEGPFIVRRGEWLYLFYSADACCGRQCNYKLGVARSKAVLGPWERHPENPILAGNEEWKCPGHGSIVEGPSGRMFLLYHAYHPTDFEHVGRQGLLDEVTWDDARGWPAINGGRGPSGRRGPAAPARGTAAVVNDDFTGRVLDPAWQWPWDQAERPIVDPERGGWLRLRTGGMPVAVAARPARAASYVAETVVDVRGVAPGARVGLAAFGNRDNLLAVTVDRAEEAGGGLSVTVWRNQKGQRATLASHPVEEGGPVHLQVKATDRARFQFAVGSDGTQWKTLAPGADGGDLPPWDLAVRVALLVAGPPTASGAFGTFRLEHVGPDAARARGQRSTRAEGGARYPSAIPSLLRWRAISRSVPASERGAGCPV